MFSSEVELQSELQFTGVLRGANNAVPERSAELRVIEQVQEIGPELQPHSFC